MGKKRTHRQSSFSSAKSGITNSTENSGNGFGSRDAINNVPDNGIWSRTKSQTLFGSVHNSSNSPSHNSPVELDSEILRPLFGLDQLPPHQLTSTLLAAQYYVAASAVATNQQQQQPPQLNISDSFNSASSTTHPPFSVDPSAFIDIQHFLNSVAFTTSSLSSATTTNSAAPHCHQGLSNDTKNVGRRNSKTITVPEANNYLAAAVAAIPSFCAASNKNNINSSEDLQNFVNAFSQLMGTSDTSANCSSVPTMTNNLGSSYAVTSSTNTGSTVASQQLKLQPRQHQHQQMKQVKKETGEEQANISTKQAPPSSTKVFLSNEEMARKFYEQIIKQGGLVGTSSTNVNSTARPSSQRKRQPQTILQADLSELRKVAFVAGVNVAIQQQMMQDKIRERERTEKEIHATCECALGNKGGTKEMSGKGPASTYINVTESNVGHNIAASPMTFGNSKFGLGNPISVGAIPPVPPPQYGWPPGTPAAAAAALASSLDINFGVCNNTNSMNSGVSDTFSHSQLPFFNSADISILLSSTDLNSPAWLEYYDAYLRAVRFQGEMTESKAHSHVKRGADETASNSLNSTVTSPEGFKYDDGNRGFEGGDESDSISEEQQLLLDADDEERKTCQAAKKRDKKARKKERIKREAEAKAALAAKKKREKTITSWRSRVVAACMSGDLAKMNILIGESPYKGFTFTPNDFEDSDDDKNTYLPQSQKDYLIRQLDWFLPNCLQKYTNHDLGNIPFRDNHARERLASHIISQSFDVVCIPGPNQLRNALHTAAYMNDVSFVRLILEGKKNALEKAQQSYEDDYNPIFSCLDALCDDAGWTPLHYATAAGSAAVFELLLEAECSVRTRTDCTLTCLNRSGYGVTARELATVLQSGDIRQDLTCDGDILDEIIELRILGASSSDKNAYMRILRSITERLEDIEINGYIPLPVKTEPQNAVNKALDAVAENKTSSTNTKKPKKKKKKQQANATPIPVSDTGKKEESKPAPITKDDLSDPVAVALLGMGFTIDQIKSSAKALGGFERATADDMVVWILNGGESIGEEQNSTLKEQRIIKNDDNVSTNSDSFLTNAPKKAHSKVQIEVEEAARKRSEEVGAAERAAAKREEQRRIRREWNEKEQARQELEKNIKLTEAMRKKKQIDMPPKTALPPAPTVPNPGFKGKVKSALGPPLTIVAGPLPIVKNVAPISNMGIPQGPTITAPKILMRPNSAPQESFPQLHSQSTGSQSLSPPGQVGNVQSITAKNHSIMTNILDTSQHEHLPAPSFFSRNTQSMESNDFYHTISDEPSNVGYNCAYLNDPSSVPLVAGSNKLYSKTSGYEGSSVPPPGFKPTVPISLATTDISLPSSPNPLGEIRATAREFIPSSFMVTRKSSMSNAIDFNSFPVLHSQQATVSSPLTRSTLNEVSSLIEPMSSMLNSFVSDSGAMPTTVPAPVTRVDSPGQSATSSMTGFSTVVDEKATSRVGSVMIYQPSGVSESGVGIDSDFNWGETNNQNSSLGTLIGLNYSTFLGDQKSNFSRSRSWKNGSGGSIW